MVDPERWRKVEELFNQALDRSEGDRGAWLDEMCADDAEIRAEVEALLESDRAVAGGFFQSEVERAVMDFGSILEPSVEGRRVGPYRLIREIGRGGMGAVYLAARDDEQYESEVAIKLVQPGLDTDFIMRRFRRERQILARLQHPNIARLFDGGTAEDGTPYLVMEYIQGSWITKYADDKDLSIDERLRLFLPVCSAVEHAHRNFIVHRDLKPGNILIDETGAPKLLDFGVSKLLHTPSTEDTQTMRIMTPDYACPEQILGEPVTIASDVYSLGAVLYELLSGVRPHRIEQCTPLALERAICLEPTVAPSAAVRANPALSRRLAGDIDNIILRAMQKPPERRYASVEHFAEDIHRYLEHRPVVARPDSMAYRAGKFVRRNRVAVALGGLVAASLIGGAALALREARIAQERSQDVRKIATTLVFEVEQASRDLPGAMPVRQLIARTGLEYLGSLARTSSRDWDLKRDLATAYVRMGELQGGVETANLGDPAGALESFQKAQALLDDVLSHSPDHKAALDRLTVAHRLGDLQREMGHAAAALAADEDGLKRADALLAVEPNDPDHVQYGAVFRLDRGRMRQQSGDLKGAAEDFEGALRLLQQLSKLRPTQRETLGNIAVSHARLGALHAEMGERQQALDNYRAGAAQLEAMIPLFPNNIQTQRDLMLAYSHMGDTLGNPEYDNFGDLEGARAAYAKMAEIARGIQQAGPADVRGMTDYGIATLRLAIVTPIAEKRAVLARSLEILDRVVARNPKDKLASMHKAWAEVELGDLQLAGGDPAGAARSYRLAIATCESTQAGDPADGPTQRWLVTAARKLSEQQARSGDRAGAVASIGTALGLAQRVDAAAPRDSVTLRSAVARAWDGAGTVYATLARQESGEARRQDLQTAREWYAKSMAEWHRLEPMRGFTAVRRKEMESAAAAQTALETAASKP